MNYKEARKMGCTHEQATAMAEQKVGGNGAAERGRFPIEKVAKKIEEEVSKPEPEEKPKVETTKEKGKGKK